MHLLKTAASIVALVFALGSGDVALGQRGASAQRGAGGGVAQRGVGRSVLRHAAGTAGGGIAVAGSYGTGGSKKSCRDTYADCMDIQINHIIARYKYLADDAAIREMQEGVEPVRCIYYSPQNVEKLFGSSAVVGSGASTNLAKYCSKSDFEQRTGYTLAAASKSVESRSENFNNLNFCANQKGINDLYFAYNYYCQLSDKLGVQGMPANRCVLATADGSLKTSAFATRDSAAYYIEANNRMKSGTLKMINIENSRLFKEKIEPMIKCDQRRADSTTGTTTTTTTSAGTTITTTTNCTGTTEQRLENWKAYSLSGAEMDDLFRGLGLQQNASATYDGEGKSTSELFSISVAPPVGAGSLDTGGTLVRASDLCFSGAALSASNAELYGADADKLSTLIQQMTSCPESSSRNDLERYYLAGTWVDACPEGYTYNPASDNCRSNDPDGTASDVEPNDINSADGEVRLIESDFFSAKKSCDAYEQTLLTTRQGVYAQFEDEFKSYLYDQVADLITRAATDMKKIADSLTSIVETDIAMTSARMDWDAQRTAAVTAAATDKARVDAHYEEAMLSIDQTRFDMYQQRAETYFNNFAPQMQSACQNMAKTNISDATKKGSIMQLAIKVNSKGQVRGSDDADKDGDSAKGITAYASLPENLWSEFICMNIPGYDLSLIVSSSDLTATGCGSFAVNPGNGTFPPGVYKFSVSGTGSITLTLGKRGMSTFSSLGGGLISITFKSREGQARSFTITKPAPYTITKIGNATISLSCFGV